MLIYNQLNYWVPTNSQKKAAICCNVLLRAKKVGHQRHCLDF
jgi:hypothetical protein